MSTSRAPGQTQKTQAERPRGSGKPGCGGSDRPRPGPSRQQQQLREPPRRLRPAHLGPAPRFFPLPSPPGPGWPTGAAIGTPTAESTTRSPEPRAGSGGPGPGTPTRDPNPVRSPRPPTFGCRGLDAGRTRGLRRRTPSRPAREQPVLRADRTSAAVPTRPLSGPNPRKALPGERGREGL